MPARLNIGVVGLGRMGRLYTRLLASQISGARVVAVADPEASARDAVRGEINVPHVFAGALDLLSRPEVDAVIVATPTHLHAEAVIEAAARGKAIFCEKPLALTLEATHAMLAAVRRADVALQVGFMRRFDAAYQEAQALIAAGSIGRPVTFKGIGRDPACPAPAFADPAQSGGLITDMAIHDFDLARWLMSSEVERVSAEGTLLVCEALQRVGDIDNAVINLRFTSGAIGNVEVSRNAFYGYDIRTEILGSEGTVRIGDNDSRLVSLRTRADSSAPAGGYLTHRFGDAYRAQIQHFVDSVRKDRPPIVGGTDALAAFEIALAATHAYRLTQPVSLAQLRAESRPETA